MLQELVALSKLLLFAAIILNVRSCGRLTASPLESADILMASKLGFTVICWRFVGALSLLRLVHV
jgi:hypothetical protein